MQYLYLNLDKNKNTHIRTKFKATEKQQILVLIGPDDLGNFLSSPSFTRDAPNVGDVPIYFVFYRAHLLPLFNYSCRISLTKPDAIWPNLELINFPAITP